MVHVSLMCVGSDKALVFIDPHGGIKRPTSESRTSKTTSGNNFMIDLSSATYHLSHSAQVDLLPSGSAGDFESPQSYIADCSDSASAHERHIRPLRTTTLIRVPGDAGLTSIAMLHLHQLHSMRHRSSLTLSDEDILRDVCRNYHELSVLAHSRWLKANPILPFHLGALEIMDRALSGSLSPPEG